MPDSDFYLSLNDHQKEMYDCMNSEQKDKIQEIMKQCDIKISRPWQGVIDSHASYQQEEYGRTLRALRWWQKLLIRLTGKLWI